MENEKLYKGKLDEKFFERFKEQLKIMEALRDKENGCPWDIVQNFETIAPYTIEEAYEVNDAIQKKDYSELKSELGDLLLQVVFHSNIAQEMQLFDIIDVLEELNNKMIRRHPHVFKDEEAKTSDDVFKKWEKIKELERKAKKDNDNSVLSNVANALPALLRAEKLSKRAANVGFDWPDIAQIFDKIDEEIIEVKEALIEDDKAHIEEEIGDLLFVCANLARKCKVNPEKALRLANEKFERRFRHIETCLKAQNKDIKQASLEEMEELWCDAKALERSNI